MRGMNMRDMKARSMNNAPSRGSAIRRSVDGVAKAEAVERRAAGKQAAADRRKEELPEPEGDDVLELGEVEVLADNGDGQFVVRRGSGASRRRDDDSEGEDLPDAPPPGWCDRW